MKCILRAKEILAEEGVLQNAEVAIEGDRIKSVGEKTGDGVEVLDLGELKLLPGLVDIHVHGGNGVDTMDLNRGAIEKLAAFKLQEGVTAFCPATVTSSLEKTKLAIEIVKAVVEAPPKNAAKIIGSFLEGPYIDKKYKGAHPEQFIREISIDELKELVEIGGGTIKSVAIAPEKEHALEAIEYLKSQNINVRIGHSNAAIEQALAAIEKGANIAVHTFNAMSPFTHREPGMVGTVLYSKDIYGEVICDLVHTHAAAVKILIDCTTPDKVVLITDCMMAGGLADGSYMLGELPVTVEKGIARTAEGALAGSTLSLISAVKNAYQVVGVSLFDAVKMASLIPARAIGLDKEIGSIAAGKKADFTAIDEEFNVKFVMVDGEICLSEFH